MVKKKLLTLDNLYTFYLNQNKTCTFSAKESGYQVSVQIPAKFEISEENKDDTLLFCTVKLMHSGENRNHSCVTDEALYKAGKNLAYKPILANFMEYVDDETGETLKDFTAHDMEINDDGTVTYFEKQIGCFTSDEPYYEVEEETGHNFLYGKCAIPIEYSDAYSIIKRKNGTKVSAELLVNEMQYNAQSKVLELTDVIIQGATCLGKNPDTLEDVGEGMLNARLDIADFSVENNSIKFNKDEKLIDLLDKLNTTLSSFNNINDSKEGGNDKNMDKFNELLEKYGKTAEDIDFEYENMSDSELEEKFEEVFGKLENNSTSEPSNDEGNSEDDESQDDPEIKEDNACGGSKKKKKKCEEDNPEEDPEEDPEIKEDNACGGGSKKKKKKNSSEEETMTRSYELSHDDIRYALYNLLASYEEADNDYYWIMEVFDTYFVYQGYTGKVYGQKYSKDGDNVAFDGERYELFMEYLTESEKAELESMRSNYSSIVEQLNAYKSAEEFADKMTVFDDDAYTEYLETDEFKTLMSKESIEKYSKDELSEKADAALGKLVKKNKTFSYSENPENKSTVVFMSNSNSDNDSKKKSPYGGIFEKYNKK